MIFHDLPLFFLAIVPVLLFFSFILGCCNRKKNYYFYQTSIIPWLLYFLIVVNNRHHKTESGWTPFVFSAHSGFTFQLPSTLSYSILAFEVCFCIVPLQLVCIQEIPNFFFFGPLDTSGVFNHNSLLNSFLNYVGFNEFNLFILLQRDCQS